jgi:outer membrane protein assembly factor BamB
LKIRKGAFMQNQWPTFQGSASRTGDAKEIVVPPLQKVWEYELGDDEIKSSPVVSNGVVYIGTSPKRGKKDWSASFYALASETGKLLWKFDIKGEILLNPTIGNGLVYFSSESQILYALDAASGKKLWEFEHGRVEWPGTSLLLAGNTLCLTTDKLYLLDAQSGECFFQEQCERENFGASPALHEGILYASLGNGLAAYDLVTKKQIWLQKRGYKPTNGPVIHENMVFVGAQGRLMALNSYDGKVIWLTALPGDPEGHAGHFLKSYPAISQGRLYIGAPDGNIYSLDARTGKGIWALHLGSYLATSPVVSGNTVYILSGMGNLYAINALSGIKMWEYTSPIIDNYDIRSTAAICDGKLFIGWDKMYAFSSV